MAQTVRGAPKHPELRTTELEGPSHVMKNTRIGLSGAASGRFPARFDLQNIVTARLFGLVGSRRIAGVFEGIRRGGLAEPSHERREDRPMPHRGEWQDIGGEEMS